MPATYEYIRPDGEWVTRVFPFAQAPATIVCEDGVVAKRGYRTAPNISWKPGHESQSEIVRKREARTKDNIAAGKRGEKEWRERMPKLKLG